MLDLAAIRNELKTQDNAITADPLFVVYERVRIYGMDPDYGDDSNLAWIDAACDYVEADESERKLLERYYAIYDREPREWRRVYWVEKRRFVTACFTRIGAESYLNRNRHNLKSPFIYVESMYRNEEMKELRNAIMSGELQASEAVA